jgi:hypothetical protein
MLILLDIDGVMVPGASWRKVEFLPDGFPDFSKKAVSGLQHIIAETQASIVLTTSHKSNYTIPQWVAIFNARGINVSIDRLSENHSNFDRKDEILNWLQNRNYNEDFVIIDDDKSLNGLPDNIKERCVLTSSIIGLDEYSASSAIDILMNSQLVKA